jgi:probable H4MPT-linked C1 transfer pathway protein
VHPEPVIGWDLGGAHLKAARLDASGAVQRVIQVACPLWQGIEHLYRAVQEALPELGPAPLHAVTMTGEMADLFPSRAEGVRRLVAAMRERLPDGALRFYAGTLGFLEAADAREAALRIASANWMASATLVARRTEAALLVDIGSTTIDLAPVREGQILARGQDDATRLVLGELLYTGVARTPVMALAERVPFMGDWVPLMAEHFATSADVYRLLGRLPDRADLHPAADGGGKSVADSARRLARMIGRDAESAPPEEWRRLAAWLAEEQARRLAGAVDRLLSHDPLPPDAPLVAAGVGRFLVADLAADRAMRQVDFATLLPAGAASADLVSDCAPAVAVGWLAQRHSG